MDTHEFNATNASVEDDGLDRINETHALHYFLERVFAADADGILEVQDSDTLRLLKDASLLHLMPLSVQLEAFKAGVTAAVIFPDNEDLRERL